MPYSSETRIILEEMLDMLSEEGFLESRFQEALKRLFREESLDDARAIADILDELSRRLRDECPVETARSQEL